MELYFPTSINREAIQHIEFVEWSNTQNQSEQMRVRLRVPKFLKLKSAHTFEPTPEQPFIDLAYFKDEAGSVELIVQASVIQHEIALDDYYTYMAEVAKENCIKKRWIDHDNDKPDLLLSKTFDDQQTWITRRFGFKNYMKYGAFVITLNMACNINLYDKYADVFYYILQSFKPVVEPKFHLAETLNLFSRRYPIDFMTYIPSSWAYMHHHNDTTDFMNAVFVKKMLNQVFGKITINTLKKQKKMTHEQMLKTYLAPYEAHGFDASLVLLSSTNALDACFKNGLAYACTFPYKRSREGKQDDVITAELSIMLAQNTENWFYIESFGFAKNENFEPWAVRKRALELVIKNLKTI